MPSAQRRVTPYLIAILSLGSVVPACASNLLKLTCSVSAVAANGPSQQNPPTLSLGQGSGALIFQTEDFAIDIDNKTASSTIVSNNTIVDSFNVSYITKEILNLTKVPIKIDTGARALVTIDRRTGQYAKKEWTIDSSGQVIGGFFYSIGVCGNTEGSRF